MRKLFFFPFLIISVILNGQVTSYYYTKAKVDRKSLMDWYGDKFVGWWKVGEDSSDYYINRIGDQQRENFVQNGYVGKVWSGRAQSYDGNTEQMSVGSYPSPLNWRLYTNSITFSLWIKSGSAPTGYNGRLIFGNGPNSASGCYCLRLLQTSGAVQFVVWDSKTARTVTSTIGICDGRWHNIVCINNIGSGFSMYIDGIYQGIYVTSGTYNNYNNQFLIGGSTNYFDAITIQLRDIRIFNRVVTLPEIANLYNQEYLTGCVGWCTCEDWEGVSGIPPLILRDVSGSGNNFTNTSTSGDIATFVIGVFPSLLNKFGYSAKTTYTDLLVGDGEFSDANEWVTSITRWEVNQTGSGKARFLGTGSYGLRNLRTINYTIYDYFEITFTISDLAGTGAHIMFQSSPGGGTLFADATYSAGEHTVIFRSASTGSAIQIYGYSDGGAFTLDNLTIKFYNGAPVLPLISNATPITDINGNTLVFKGQAKYNLLKSSELKMIQDTLVVGEIREACAKILRPSADPWYTGDTPNNINWADIETQSLVQYINDAYTELILVKAKAILDQTADKRIQEYLGTNKPYDPSFKVYMAIGTTDTSKTTTEIYATAIKIKDEGAIGNQESLVTIFPSSRRLTLNPAHKYYAMGWADFFPTTDRNIILPLAAKYNFGQTFYVPTCPDGTYSEAWKFPIERLKMVEELNCRFGDHCFLHIAQIYACPSYDGRTVPTDSDFKTDRGDGRNEWGHKLTETVETSLGAINCEYLWLSSGTKATVWSALTTAQCKEIRQGLGVFGMTKDPTNGKEVLSTLDYLSSVYCGTTGTSVYNDDYTYATRKPKTADGNEPSAINPILGGIFQGAATTFNHEIWERVQTIQMNYRKTYSGQLFDNKFWGVAGTGDKYLYYKIGAAYNNFLSYQDKAHTHLATGCVKYTSSILGTSRSWGDVLRAAGYKITMATMGTGYAYSAYDQLPRLECQRTIKLNASVSNTDNIGDGYSNDLRIWIPGIADADQTSLFDSTDLVRGLYNFMLTDSNWSGNGAVNNFAKSLNEAIKRLAWGTIPVSIGDSYTPAQAGQASLALVHEALFQFCLRAGITPISIEQAAEVAYDYKFSPSNYFPNPTFGRLIDRVFTSVNAPTFPDGWDGGVILSDTVNGDTVNVLHFENSSGVNPMIKFTRQYALKIGTVAVSIWAKGEGTIIIKKIRNNDTQTDANGTGYETWLTIPVNSISYAEVTSSGTIENAAMETYSAPATPEEESYQNYMRGYGEKVCGLHIEVQVAPFKELTIAKPSITITP